MQVRTVPLTIPELTTLMQILSDHELEILLKHQEPEFVADLYDQIQAEANAAEAMAGKWRVR
jgi:hypothetical protein